MRKYQFTLLVLKLLIVPLIVFSQDTKTNDSKVDSIQKAQKVLNEAKIEADKKEIKINIRNVDISEYPIIKVIVEAFNIYGVPLDTLVADNLAVLENGQKKEVISVEKISINERVPVDFVFVIDKTGSMQTHIDNIRKKVSGFASYLMKRGIDYRLGLVLFSDYIERTYQPTEDVKEFLKWLGRVRASGGYDTKENALDAINKTFNMDFRPSANKVIVLITDAPYHQKGEKGKGVTNYTTETIIDKLQRHDVRVFAIVPPKLSEYKEICEKTRGYTFDIDYPFAAILDNFSSQLTNLYALKYRTAQPAIPDSIEIIIINEKNQQLTKKTIPIVELGRKLIIENMLFNTASSELPGKVKELDVLTQFMLNRKNVVIMVEGHTDNIGSHALNDVLSIKRANSVKDYLISKGVSPHRVKTRGLGERKPIASNNTEFGRKLNRRTEIIIVSK